MTQTNMNKFIDPIVVKDPTKILSYRTMIWDINNGRVDVRNRLNLLQKKKVFTEGEFERLHMMIDSDDLENLEVVKCILDQKENDMRKNFRDKTFMEKLKFWRK